MQTIFTKQTRDGRLVEVFGDMREPGSPELRHVKLAGKPVGWSPMVARLLDSQIQGEHTYYITSKPPIALTTAEAEQIAAALQQMRQEWEKTPEAQPVLERERLDSLRRERRDLVTAHQGLIEEQAHQFRRAHDRQDARAHAIKEQFEAQIAAAEQAVRDFDAAHPEVLAAIQAENAESVERNRWM